MRSSLQTSGSHAYWERRRPALQHQWLAAARAPVVTENSRADMDSTAIRDDSRVMATIAFPAGL